MTTSRNSRGGFTLIELLVAVALLMMLASFALPLGSEAIDDLRTASAARYLAGRIAASRMDAIRRSRAVALRFQPAAPDYQFAAFVDGNGNGVRSAEIASGVDLPVGISRRLADD